jgi:hypothetical protein
LGLGCIVRVDFRLGRLEPLEDGVSDPRDTDRDRKDRDLDRERDRSAREEENERRAETERRSEQLWEAWRNRHPVREDDKGRPKKEGPS